MFYEPSNLMVFVVYVSLGDVGVLKGSKYSQRCQEPEIITHTCSPKFHYDLIK